MGLSSTSSRPAGADEESVPADESSPLVPGPVPAATAAGSQPRHRSRANCRQRILQQKPPPRAALFALLFVTGVLALTFLATAQHEQRRRRPADDSAREHLVTARHGAVASDVGICSQIGVDILRDRNGSAVDAAIATAVCIGVVNMYSSGIGGGGFMVIRDPEGASRAINFREMAPGAAHRDMFTADPMRAQVGGLAAGVPGEIAGFHAAWKMYGRVPWRELFLPSIALCEGGFEVTPFLSRMMEEKWEGFLDNANREEWGFLFRAEGEGGGLLGVGEVMYRPALGKTLSKIAEGGPAAFYGGEVAEQLVGFVKRRGGVMTVGDMARYTALVEDTLKVWAFGREILTCAPPCSGAVLIEGLNIAEGLDMPDDESGLAVHRTIETMKWLSAGRTELGDPSDPALSNAVRVAEIQSKQFAAMVRRNISDSRTYGWEHYNPSYEFKESKGTSHMSTLDADGMAVALTTTVNLYFGAKICDPETGIVLNNQMDDFAIPGTDNAFRLQPSIYNYIKPYKRPLSSTAPTITVYNGYPSLIIGGSGGSRIVTSVFLSFIKVYKWGYSLVDTIRSPRVHHQLIPEVAYVETGLMDDVTQGLRDRGHVVEELPAIGSVIQAIHRLPDGEIHAVSDYWRKGGRAAGY